ncbi:nuclease [Steccherinum ochraceum]|uniref:U6 snRNA phosphodiesterase n=1 Tax=Steccherinum ochraceum TaxID=92696 RepID=A0A4R0R4X1_9APHY|nr:nuclease [Steccherinum ochraceum]
MKRGLPLVQYGSDDDDDDDTTGDTPSAPTEAKPPAKKRKLPNLSSTFVPAGPVDNPALHQGRVRTAPHVEGQYAAYVYVPVRLELERKSKLAKLLRRTLLRAREIAPTLHPIGIPDTKDGSEDGIELHISLSRPIYLRAHQREELKRAVRTIAKSSSPFDASFATFAELENDERTRTFVTVEIGAGHAELATLTNALTPTLHSIRQKTFYDEPRFHASIAWALLAPCEDRPGSSDTPSDSGIPASLDSVVAQSVCLGSDQFARIDRLPAEVISTLKSEFGAILVEQGIAVFHVDTICIRIGKDVSQWKLE